MMKTKKANQRTRLFAVWATLACALFYGSTNAVAQGGGCAVGARVNVELMGDEVGTITEIGTSGQYVGWYRIVFESNVRAGNSKGDWFSPKNREIVVVGTNTKCGRDANYDDCPMNEPSGKVTQTSPPSAQLFKRVIYESMKGKVKLGLTFLEFEMGKAYRNPRTDDVYDTAALGAMVYPVKTKYVQCHLFDTFIRRDVKQTNYVCFKNRNGDWDCPVNSTTKTLESRDIKLK